MLKINILLISVFSSLLLVLVSSCGVKEAGVGKNEIFAPKLSVFQNRNFRAVDNRIFLWPEQILPDQVSRAIEIGKVMDRVQSESIGIRTQLTQIRNRLKANEDQIDLAYLKSNSEKNELRTKLKDLRTIAANLKSTREKKETEAQKPIPDLMLIQSLEDKQAEIEKIHKDLSGQIDQSKEKIKMIDLEISRLTDAPELSLEKTKKDDIEQKLQLMTEIGEKSLREVQSLVYWFEPQPSEISMIFENDGSLSVTISGWAVNQDEGPRDFSTQSKHGQKPTIQNARFTPLGGIFEFDVLVYNDLDQTHLRETYSFRLALNPPDSENSAGYLVGDVTLSRYLPQGKKETQKGQAKLIDRLN
jgi:hypothetical protein